MLFSRASAVLHALPVGVRIARVLGQPLRTEAPGTHHLDIALPRVSILSNAQTILPVPDGERLIDATDDVVDRTFVGDSPHKLPGQMLARECASPPFSHSIEPAAAKSCRLSRPFSRHCGH